MKRFENAQIGDRVFSHLYQRNGVITKIYTAEDVYQIRVKFDGDITCFYDPDGRENINHKEPSLVYINADGNTCTERPEPPIDWKNVEPGTEFEVRSNIGSDWTKREFIFYAKDEPWFLYEHNYFRARTWNYIRRI